MISGDPWLIDVRIANQWKPTPGYEATLADAQRRADAVHHWCGARVRNAVTGKSWVREAGKGCVEGDPLPPPSNPRSPIRAPQNAVAEQPNYWWREKE